MECTRNYKVRKAILESGLKQWKVAELIGIRDDAFSRKLRYELPEDEQNRIIDAISNYLQGKEVK